MKILVVGHSLIVNQNRTFWNTFARESGFQVDLLFPKKWKSNLFDKLNFKFDPITDSNLSMLHSKKVCFSGSGSFYMYSCLSLWLLLMRKSYDIIIINQETWSLSFWQLMFLKALSKNRKARTFLMVAQNIKKQNLRFLHIFERLFTKKVEKILCCCSEIVDVIKWKKIKSDCYYFPLSFDSAQYANLEHKELSSPIIFGYLGRLNDAKGVDLLIEVFKQFYQEKVPVRLVIGGLGPLEEQLRKNIFIDYLGPFQHHRAHKFYRKVDALILPSKTTDNWKEQFGRVLIEAAAGRKFVLGSDSGAIPEVLANLEHKFTFKENSVEDLKKLILEVKKLFENGRHVKMTTDLSNKAFALYSDVAVAKRLTELCMDVKSERGKIDSFDGIYIAS